MNSATTWHGTREEWAQLWLALGTHCTCEFDEMTGAERAMCCNHAMLENQAVLDHLLHVRRLREWFIHREWDENALNDSQSVAPADIRPNSH
jgi:hypothetical protein